MDQRRLDKLLIDSVKSGRLREVKEVVQQGANVNAQDKEDMTPAELAQSKGNREMAKLIIDEALQRLFKHGLRKGNVQLTNMRLVLMGPPCVGKTAFKSLLFNWSAPRFHNSTALATRPIRALERVAGRNEGKIWEKVTRLDLLRMLSDAIHALEQDSQQEMDDLLSEDASGTTLSTESLRELTTGVTSITGLAKRNETKFTAPSTLSTAVTSTMSETDSNELDSDNESIIKPNQREMKNEVLTTSSRNTTISSDKASRPAVSSLNPAKELFSHSRDINSDQYSRELTEVLAKQKKSKNRHKATWINVLDSGGQPQFADVSRAFIRGNNINIICTKLTESLFEKPQFCYSLNGKLLNQPSELQMNNLFNIDSCSRAFPRQLRYAVLLYSEDLFGSVLLVDRFYWIEVYYNGVTKNCFKLRKVICEAISACTDILAYDEGAPKAEVTVPCKQEHSESGHKLHSVIISWNDDPPLLRCSIEKQLPTLELIDERQTCWLIDPCSVTSRSKTTKQHADNSDLISVSSNLPNGPLDECHLSALVKFVKEVDDWEILGIHLGIKDAVIKDIKVLNHFQPAPSRKDMLVKWLKGGHANRADFIKALRAIDENRIVQDILSQNDERTDIPSTITEAANDSTK